MNITDTDEQRFVICVRNDDYPASLEVRKIYLAIQDPAATKHQLLRIVDESGEDYLYPEDHFVPIDLPQPVKQALLAPA